MIHNSLLGSNTGTLFIDNYAFVMLFSWTGLKHLKDNELHYIMKGKMEKHVLYIEYIQ